MRLVVSFCRSMFASSSESECTWVRSRSSSCSTSDRSRRMLSNRCWLSRNCWSKGWGRWEARDVTQNRGSSYASPRRFFETSFRDASYPSQMSTYGRCTPEQPNQRAESYDRERLDVREERRLDEPAVDEGVRPVGEPDRDEPAQHPLDGSFQQERAADEAVGGGHEPHDGDLAAALQHRHADR